MAALALADLQPPVVKLGIGSAGYSGASPSLNARDRAAVRHRPGASSSLIDLLHQRHQTVLIKLYPVRRDVVPHSEVEDPGLVADR